MRRVMRVPRSSRPPVDGFLDSTQHLPGEPLWWCPEEEVFVGPSHAELFNADGQLIEVRQRAILIGSE
jgi:hypothetical protein